MRLTVCWGRALPILYHSLLNPFPHSGLFFTPHILMRSLGILPLLGAVFSVVLSPGWHKITVALSNVWNMSFSVKLWLLSYYQFSKYPELISIQCTWTVFELYFHQYLLWPVAQNSLRFCSYICPLLLYNCHSKYCTHILTRGWKCEYYLEKALCLRPLASLALCDSHLNVWEQNLWANRGVKKTKRRKKEVVLRKKAAENKNNWKGALAENGCKADSEGVKGKLEVDRNRKRQLYVKQNDT